MSVNSFQNVRRLLSPDPVGTREAGHSAVGQHKLDWSQQSLQRLLAHELPGADLVVVSNREPYIHVQSDDGITLQSPASGLVSAIEPMMRACGGTWIAHGHGSADQLTVDHYDRLRVPPASPAYTLRRIWLSEEEQAGYYYGFANEGLWPLCHIAFVRPVFRETDWQTYAAVNERFAEAVAREAHSDEPIVLVQDYHFALLPRFLRARLPKATILTFWHIPWPNSETFGICPWKREIVEGLLSSTILGFHTRDHCNNFLGTVDKVLESRVDWANSSVTFASEKTLVRPYPISVEWPPVALETQPPIAQCWRNVRARLGLTGAARLAVGVERLDYTKGIIERMHAIDELLTQNPEWQGRFVFYQAAAPSRTKLDSYRALQSEAIEVADRINSKYADGSGYMPIMFALRHHTADEVFELFRAADVCIVSSLHDGMNLVAKEFVAARSDEHGVLILSKFAGASRELVEALIVNPYDTHAMGRTIIAALNMPRSEQRERMRIMRAQVRDHNIYRWAGHMLMDVAEVRKHQRIADLVDTSFHTGA